MATVPHTVTWDNYSVMVDGQRVFLWSGEFHAYRLPSPDLWRDILQKMKSNGYNAVSFYFDWAYSSPKSGVYDFSGVRDVDELMNIAAEVGIYVIARPGPYINAEVDSGGFPGWLQETSGTARTSNATYMSYTDQWQTAIDAILARHQLTTGTGTMIMYQIENEYASNVNSSTGKDYMAHLYAKARADGITVPIMHNDKGRNGYWVPGSFTTPPSEVPPNYLYGFDSYPGGTCSTSGNPGTPGAPPDYGYFGSGGSGGGASASRTTPGLIPEFGGGWFDPWGDLLFGGAGYQCLRTRENAAYERQYYLTNVANGITTQNIYMSYGGTSWGWLPAPVVYTSYDYGAAIDEGRQLTSKVPAMKEMGYFLQSVTDIDALGTQLAAASVAGATNIKVNSTTGLVAGQPITVDVAGKQTVTIASVGTAGAAGTGITFTPALTAAHALGAEVTGPKSSNTPISGVTEYHDVNPETGAGFYFLRSDSTSANASFTLPIITPDGSYTIPQSGTIQMQGVDMKALVTNYNMDSQHLVYSTSQIMTHAANLNGQDLALLYTWDAQSGETVFRYPASVAGPTVTTLSGPAPTVTWNGATKDLRLNYSGSSASVVQISGDGVTTPLELILAPESVAQTFWRLDTASGPVILRGPELLRTANVNGSEVDLTGDTTTAAVPLEVWAPAGVTSVTWNGNPITTTATGYGSLLASSTIPAAPAITLPAITGWTRAAEAPEAQPNFDDSSWQVVDKTTTNSHTPIVSGQMDMWADDYGFHYGDVWYRGTYTNSASATALSVNYQTGTVGMIEVWLDGTYLGVNQIATPTSGQSTTATWSPSNVSFAIPPAMQDSGTHKIAILYTIMSHEEDGGANNSFKNGRGVSKVTLTGSTTIPTWKIQGVQNGEDIVDTTRGAMNTGGLYGERAGWYLPGYPDGNWTPVTLPYLDTTAGVAWYRTTFDLAIPSGVDQSIGLNITDINNTKQYRAEIFVNGWMMGLYINNVGPQHTFVIPNGILRTNGTNTLAIAVVTNQDNGTATTGGGLGNVTLVNLGTAASSLTVADVNSPAYVAPTVTGVDSSATVLTSFTGTVATVSAAPDSLGTVFTATIDWGDGTTSPGTLTGSAGSYTVSGTHTFTTGGSHTVTTTLTDSVDSSTLATGTSTHFSTQPPVVTNDAPAGGATVQYSDALSPTVTISATDPDSNGSVLTAAASGLPAGMSLASGSTSADGDLPGTHTWTVTGATTAAPGLYPVTVTVTDELGQHASTSFKINVGQENADATYTGDELVFTAPGGNSASVLLRTTVRDSSLYDPGDTAPGDIRNANVTFKEGSTVLCGPSAVQLLGTDTTLGTFSCTTSLGVGAHTISIYVGNYYVGTAGTLVEVATPDGSFITGGGFQTASSSAGTYAAPPGSQEQVAFNVKYLKNNKNLQGHVSVIIVSGGRTYEISSNAIDSMGTALQTAGGLPCSGPPSSTCFGLANFRSKANLIDITDPLNPVVIAGNLSLQVTMTDRGEPGSNDTIGITLYKGNTLLFSSEWNGAKTVEATLTGGNLVVH